MAAVEHHIRLAQSLPPRLLHFFKRWPPAQISTSIPPPPPQPTETIQVASNTSPSDPNALPTTSIPTSSPEETSTYPTRNQDRKLNPFLPFRNPRTGNWHSPHYSLRRQAELFKLARSHSVLSLMPHSPKHPEVKEQKRIERGVRVQGTGVGKKVKGKQWERSLKGRLEERRKAMEEMPEMIRNWKQRGHGRGIRKWPR